MTNREFYTAIATNETLGAEIREFAGAQLAKMDLANTKRREKNAETSAENARYVEMLLGVMSTTPKTGEQLVADMAEAGVLAINDKPVTKQKIATMLRASVAEGVVVKDKVKVDKSTATTYALAQ